MSVNLTSGQSLEEVILAIEFRHLYISVPYFSQRMGITASALDNTVLLSEGPGFSGTVGKGASGIKYFYDVNLLYYFVYYPTT